MSFVPQFRLYASDGTTLVYTFTYVQNIDDFSDPSHYIEHESLRGQGSIIVPGSDQAYDMTLQFIIKGTDYTNLCTLIDTLNTTVSKFTKFILKIDTSISTTKDYKVMRLQPIVYPIGTDNKRIKLQRVEMTLRNGAWS